MEASGFNSRQRMSMSQHLSYPNPSLGDTAGFAAANLSPREIGIPAAARSRKQVFSQVVVIISLLLGLLLATLDTSVVATSLVTISEELHNHGDAPWVLLAYLLTYMGCSVGVAKLSDIYGRRTLLILSWCTFLIWSIGCTASRSMMVLIICRALKGVGGAGLYSLTQICLLEHGPTNKPSLMGALIGATLALAFLLGPILGGAISSKVSWRWIFAINLPFGCFALCFILFFYPREPRAVRILSIGGLKKVDFLGIFTLMVASICLVLGIQKGGSRESSWDSPLVIIAFVASAISGIFFLVWEFRVNATYCPYPVHSRCTHIEPVLTAALARRRPYMFGLLVTFLTGIPYVALTVTIPERMQVLKQENAFNAGIHLIPMLAGCAMGSFMAGAVCRNRNNTGMLMISSASFQVLGIGLMIIVAPADSSFLPAYGFTLVFGMGVGVSFGAATIIGAVETESANDIAVAQGAIAQARVLGGCIGVAICTVLYNNRLDSLADHLSPKEFDALQRSPTVAKDWDGDRLHHIQDVYANAFRDQIIFMLIICVVMAFASFFIWEKNPRPIAHLRHAQQAHKESLQQGRNHSDGTELSDLASIRSV